VQVSSRQEGLAAVGNIFTRPDCRGQGLAQIVTSAVVTSLRAAGIQTIGLNVDSTNTRDIWARFSTRHDSRMQTEAKTPLLSVSQTTDFLVYTVSDITSDGSPASRSSPASRCSSLCILRTS
jgi:hypothetical protein